MMYLRVILFLFACYLSISAISIVIYKNAQFIPTNTTVKLVDLYSINSRDECACQCFINNSSCLTASYVGLNRSCSLFSTKVKFNWLHKMTNITNSSVLTFANESLLRCATFDFQQSPNMYATGSAPVAMVSADFNHDGHLDLAISNSNGNSISISLDIGNGSFQLPAISYNCNGTNPYWLVTHDFNHDGNLDLAVCNEGSNTISILLGVNNGSFQTPAITFNSGGTLPSSIIAVDVNNDSEVDLVVTNTGTHLVTVFLGFGNGTFQISPTSYAANTYPSSLASGDFNSDGNIDLAVVSRATNHLFIFIGNGNGTFRDNSVNYMTGLFPYVVRSADFNGDSKVDLVVGNFNGNTIRIYMGTGTGTFTTSSSAIYATGISNPIDIAIQDLNGDMKLDLAISNQNANVSIYFGYGNGTFGNTKMYSSTGQTLKGIIAADFNEDGLYDLAVLNSNNNNLAVFSGQCS